MNVIFFPHVALLGASGVVFAMILLSSFAGRTDDAIPLTLLLAALPVGAILRCGSVTLQVTQIGKECHQACAIRQRVGTCIMPHQGIFARVLSGGIIKEGDVIAAEEAPAAV